MKDRIIEGRYRVVGEERERGRRRLRPTLAAILTHRGVWFLVGGLTLIGLIEGW